MSTPVREFVVKTLETMNFDTAGLTETTPLGKDGVELESLAMAELVMQVEEEYGISFSEEDVESMEGMTFGQFLIETDSRVRRLAASGEPA